MIVADKKAPVLDHHDDHHDDQHDDQHHLRQKCGRPQLIENQVHFSTPLLVPSARVAHSHLVIKFMIVVIIIILNKITFCQMEEKDAKVSEQTTDP